MKNWCLRHWRGSALGFPFGEAGTQIGTSEPIWVTEEVWYRVNIRFAVGKNQRFGVFLLYSSVFIVVPLRKPLPPQCAHWGTFPKGEGKALRAAIR